AKMQRRLVQIDESIARYLSQLDSADRQGEAVPEAKITRLNEKIATLRQEIQRLNALNSEMMQTEDKQISLTDPDARSMATSGRGSGMVGYNVQSAVDTKHHLIVTHEVTNVGSDRSQLSRMSEQARAAIGSEAIEAVADRGYYSGEEIVACEQAGITVYLPKPMTSGLLAKGRFGKQDFVYVAADDVYLCPADEQLTYHYTNEEEGKTLRRYWTTACQVCALKSKCTTGKERRISRWEHEAILEAVQARFDRSPAKMRERRQTVEHPFGTIKSWMGATHFQMKTLKNVGTEMALHVLAYNMKRAISILGVGGLMEAIRA
ncbi:MAG: IS1182 family transposase, partial [Bradyrhizobium sp.]|uniref:IS1182 family transposase n=1 Tax=Bradyrhizobium sp. TaxID=376 RepID=UPI003BAE5F4B